MTHDHHHDHPHGHGHAHDHAADRAHGHSHAAGGHHHHGFDPGAGSRRAFAIAVALNSLFVVAEFAFGFVANSTALMADAGHNLSDVLGLLLAWGAAVLSGRPPNGRFTYGLRSTSIFAALGNGTMLFFACGAIAWEAVQRLSSPPAVTSVTVVVVAAIGIVVNGLSAWLFLSGSRHDLNVRGAYLHMAADAAVSLGVVVAGLAMMATGWYVLDPVVSIVIVAVILAGTWGLLRESLRLALNAVPAHIDAASVESYLRAFPGVKGVHDLHIWGMSTTESALTVHLVMPDGHPGDGFMDEVSRGLHERFAVQHSTLQVELGTTEHACALQRPPGHG